MAKAASSPAHSREKQAPRPPPHPLPGISHSSAQRKNEPEPVLRCVRGPDIGLPVVTMSARAFVHGMLTNSYYSLCPFLSSGAHEMIYQQELRTGCRVLGRGRRLEKSFYEIKAWSPKGHTAAGDALIHSLMHPFNTCFLRPRTKPGLWESVVSKRGEVTVLLESQTWGKADSEQVTCRCT